MEARAQLKYLKGSPQKVRLVVDLIRGKKVEEAIQILRFTKKLVAKDIEKLLRSAVANAENSEAGADVDELFVTRIVVDDGPRDKRIQPAPMGRAFRIQKRKSHVTVLLSDQVTVKQEAKPAERRASSPAEAGKVAGAARQGAGRSTGKRKAAPARKKPARAKRGK